MSIDRYIGEIQVWPLEVIPPNWALCDGRLMDIPTNHALYSLLGTQFGGDGQTTFALPDLRGRTPVGASLGSNEPMPVGAMRGLAEVELDATNLPRHSHDLMASTQFATNNTILNAIPAATALSDPPIYAPNSPNVVMDPDCIEPTGTSDPAGMSRSHNNMQPSLGLNFIIAIAGQYPSPP